MTHVTPNPINNLYDLYAADYGDICHTCHLSPDFPPVNLQRPGTADGSVDIGPCRGGHEVVHQASLTMLHASCIAHNAPGIVGGT